MSVERVLGVMSSFFWQLFRRPTVAPSQATELKRCLGLRDLVTFGIGSTIGRFFYFVSSAILSSLPPHSRCYRLVGYSS